LTVQHRKKKGWCLHDGARHRCKPSFLPRRKKKREREEVAPSPSPDRKDRGTGGDVFPQLKAVRKQKSNCSNLAYVEVQGASGAAAVGEPPAWGKNAHFGGEQGTIGQKAQTEKKADRQGGKRSLAFAKSSFGTSYYRPGKS